MPFVGTKNVVIPAKSEEIYDQWKIMEMHYSENQLAVTMLPFRMENNVEVEAPKSQIQSIFIEDLMTLASQDAGIAASLASVNQSVRDYAVAKGLI